MVRFVQRGKILNLLNINFQEHYFFSISKELLFHVPFVNAQDM
jgi:hypothetical protein